ncbi:unnamed protein product [Brachionus calyciflorus]|uniref:Methyltransferase type 11 domain-containing protein n=1 Tax=Brachionus calyciflorus TaxID=104777 RepID=A0A814FJY4_9BILA|nr:unnamed protein product [Brachionus calyciflorus]
MPSHSGYSIALVSLTSGALSIAGYILLKRFLCKNMCKKSKKAEQSKIYEEKALLDQYMLFNYADAKDFILFDLNEYSNVYNCVSFPRNVALLCRDHCPEIFFADQPHPRRALDVGCAVGRSCFELSKLFDEVIGIDYSANFINHCNKFLNEKFIEYECTLEGDINQKLTCRLDHDVDGSKIKFEVGDACNLRDDLGEFDLVLASNLICQNWIGGYVDENGQEVHGLDGLKNAMCDTFDLVHEMNLPMMIRETRRKFQFTVCLITIWQRK